ncbi:phosphopentomutase [Klebsiella aerogenes]|nr:phosphopentomutase [Klebsiella aerogenes]
MSSLTSSTLTPLGHRRDVALRGGSELFDRRLPELMELVGEETFDLTATMAVTDLTYDIPARYPVLVYAESKPGSLGHRETFANRRLLRNLYLTWNGKPCSESLPGGASDRLRFVAG